MTKGSTPAPLFLPNKKKLYKILSISFAVCLFMLSFRFWLYQYRSVLISLLNVRLSLFDFFFINQVSHQTNSFLLKMNLHSYIFSCFFFLCFVLFFTIVLLISSFINNDFCCEYFDNSASFKNRGFRECERVSRNSCR